MEEQLDPPSHNSQLTSFGSFLSDQDFGSHTGNSFNGFDHQEAYRINNADKTDMLNRELEFDSVQKRLETFIRWPVDSPINPQDLAEAGFYSLGMDDRVVCFRCDLHLLQWKAGDDPWREHKKLRPRCPFILDCESGRDYNYEVTCGPVEVSSKDQDPAEISLTQNYPGYGPPTYPEKPKGTYVKEVAVAEVSSYLDPKGVRYSERPQYATQGREYGYHEQPYAITHPVDVQVGYHDQRVHYPRVPQEFLDRDPRSMQFQCPEHQTMGTEITKHVVVGQGSNQVHIVGSGASYYKINPKDKLVVHSGGQSHLQQVRAVRDLTPVFPEVNQTSQFPSKFETSFTGSRVPNQPSQYMEPSQYSSEEPMSGRYQPPVSIVSYASSDAGQFANQPGYEYSGEKKSTEGKGSVEFIRSVGQNTVPQGGNAKYIMQQYPAMNHSQEMYETSAPNQPPLPQKAPGQMYYQQYSTEKAISNESELLQENCYLPQRYPGTTSETREPIPYQPTRESQSNRWQDPSGHSAQGSRRPSPFAAFPVTDPSLRPTQRPLVRNEDARHVTSSSDLASEHHRLTTFVDWPHDHHIRPMDLSAAGFFYLGTGDSVECYKCGIRLHNWDPTDTPWGEHQKWSPRCALVLDYFSGRSRQREEHVSRQSTATQPRFTTPQDAFQYQRPQQNQGLNDRQVPIRSSDPPVHAMWGRSKSFPAPTLSNVARPQSLPLDQQHPHWHAQPTTTSQGENHMIRRQSGSSDNESSSSQDRRSCSPRGSAALEFNMEKLAEMGFTQQQINDAISAQIEATGSTFSTYAELVSALLEMQGQPTEQTCPQSTNQGCQGASPPPPIVFSRDITSSLPRESQDFRERNCVSAVTSPTTPVPDRNSLRRSLSAPAQGSSESGEESLEEKLERMQEERMCKICMDAEVSVVFLPCGHLSCCANCANGMDFCPMCRALIHRKIRTYLS